MSSGTAKTKRSLSDYFSASQLRLDTWHSLKHLSAQLAERPEAGDGHERLPEKVNTTLQDLAPIETYWAFPSEARFDDLRRTLARGEYESLARAVGYIVRALTSASYRRRVRSTNDADIDKERHTLKTHLNVSVAVELQQ